MRASIIPHSVWGLHQWFAAESGWYYHRPCEWARQTTLRVHTRDINPVDPMDRDVDRVALLTARAMERIDPQLRELCSLLHRQDIQTTASCQGHNHSPAYFEETWEGLQKEKEMIRREGLVFTNSASDGAFFFRDPGFMLPWNTLEEFQTEASAEQHVGYVGLVIDPDPYGVPNETAQNLLSALRRGCHSGNTSSIRFAPLLSRATGLASFGIYVTERTEEARALHWKALTRMLAGILNAGSAPLRVGLQATSLRRETET